MTMDNSCGTLRAYTEYSYERFKELLVMFVVDTNQPFSVVENERFRELLLYLRSDFKIPKADALRRAVITEFKLCKKLLMEKLSVFSGVLNCTLDLWTSPANMSYMAITVHWVDENFSLQNALLSFVEISDSSHTADTLLKYFVEQLENFGITPKADYLFY
jgi:hypothetical protein